MKQGHSIFVNTLNLKVTHEQNHVAETSLETNFLYVETDMLRIYRGISLQLLL